VRLDEAFGGRVGRTRDGAQQDPLPFGHFVEDVGPELAEDLAAGALGLDHAGGLETGDVPADKRLAEADGVDQIADVAGPSASRLTMRRRFTSASALWNTRNSRRSSGWSTIAATVPLKCAGDGK
jgi:hypothetical protein